VGTVRDSHTHFKEVTLKKVVNASRYYFFDGRRIALRRDGVVQYVLADHLGSTTLVLDQNGAKVDEMRYREASRSAAEWITPTAPNAGPWTAPFQLTIASPMEDWRELGTACDWGRIEIKSGRNSSSP
jgi:hypothetical protein